MQLFFFFSVSFVRILLIGMLESNIIYPLVLRKPVGYEGLQNVKTTRALLIILFAISRRTPVRSNNHITIELMSVYDPTNVLKYPLWYRFTRLKRVVVVCMQNGFSRFPKGFYGPLFQKTFTASATIRPPFIYFPISSFFYVRNPRSGLFQIPFSQPLDLNQFISPDAPVFSQ